MRIFNYLIIITVFFCMGCSPGVYQYESHIEFNSTLSLENISDSMRCELNLKNYIFISHPFIIKEDMFNKGSSGVRFFIESPYNPVIKLEKSESKYTVRIFTWNYVYDYKNEKSLEVKELRDILKKWSEKHPKTILNYSAKGKINGRTRGILN